MNEQYYICDICDEDLNVTEKWLIKVSIIETDPDDEDCLVQRKLVFELVQEILDDDAQKALELSYEICKLPIWFTNKEVRLLKAYGRFERLVDA